MVDLAFFKCLSSRRQKKQRKAADIARTCGTIHYDIAEDVRVSTVVSPIHLSLALDKQHSYERFITVISFFREGKCSKQHIFSGEAL